MPRFPLALVLAVAIVPVAAAGGDDAPPTVTLTEYISRNSLESVTTKQFIFMRCGALFLLYAAAIGPGAQADKFSHVAAKLFEAAQMPDTATQRAFVLDQGQRMLAMYMERAKSAKARTGNWSDDSIIKSDADVCTLITK